MRVALLLSLLALLSLCASAKKSTCKVPLSYWKGLNWTKTKQSCTKVGPKMSVDACDSCFAAFVSAQKPAIIQYIDIAAAIANPAGTLASTVDACGSTVTKTLASKLSTKEKQKAKNVEQCFKLDVSQLPRTQAAVSGLVASIGK